MVGSEDRAPQLKAEKAPEENESDEGELPDNDLEEGKV